MEKELYGVIGRTKQMTGLAGLSEKHFEDYLGGYGAGGNCIIKDHSARGV